MIGPSEQLWYKNAVFYSLDVETFYDSSGDGRGDFPGLIEKLDYLAGLGINCIWLLPFYPSPNHDNGYDVMDYFGVDETLGSLGDFAVFLEKATQLGIRVIIDLVVNHTSIEHPWFQAARNDRNSPFRDFYVWSDEPKKFKDSKLMLKGEEDTMWSYDEKAGQYYLHRFYKEQPDLNLGNKKLREEIFKIMAFWLKLGVSGFRIDAAEIMIENYGQNGVKKEDLLDFFNDMYDFTLSKRRDAVLLAEVNGDPKKMAAFLDNGKRVQMIFNFYLNQHIFLALVQQNASTLAKALRELPRLSNSNQFLNFLRHHDELNLKLLNKKQMHEVFEELGPEENMRIFGFGIRRRLAPMFHNNIQRMKLAYSLLFSMPGTPLIRYGDEIGMGDDLSLEGRTSVRTPMQWSGMKNGGFSSAAETELVPPVISKGAFSFEKINVLKMQHDGDTLLNWIEQLIITRKQCAEIGAGKLEVLKSSHDPVLVHRFSWNGTWLYCIHNLADMKFICNKKDHGIEAGKIFDVLSDASPYEDNDLEISINPFGFRWIRIENKNEL